MKIVALPARLADVADLRSLNAALRSRQSALDWSGVEEAGPEELERLLRGLDISADAEALGLETVPEKLEDQVNQALPREGPEGRRSPAAVVVGTAPEVWEEPADDTDAGKGKAPAPTPGGQDHGVTIHPIAVVDQVTDEYESYLLTEFRARDARLRTALEEALLRPLFLAQEPFFQAHRPFKEGRPWRELGLDAKLARVMEVRSGSSDAYHHQGEAIVHLLSPGASPLVVTTGTGSGKSECFLLPVLQNAIEDSVRFNRRGLTAILVYPMNALANDQEQRIREYLTASGHTHVQVRRYDRSTKEAEREAMRKHPPHILLTNYMMLEYLLVRPADREALFANHRCRFLVLDEVHSYRGSLGSNIALLVRRLRAHLADALQDFAADDRGDARRFPGLVPVATSATIKSIEETGRSREEVRRLRDLAVQEFLEKLTGFPSDTFRVIGEELRHIQLPAEARWPVSPAVVDVPEPGAPEAVREAAAALAGLPSGTPLETAARHAGILWFLGDILARRPLSVSQLADIVIETVPERSGATLEDVEKEVYAALVVGAALPGEVPGALRLRVHRFLRGGWQFHRCVNPACGRLHAMGEAECACGKRTAPLLLCRSCGADALHFTGEEEPATLRPRVGPPEGAEWVLYDTARNLPEGDDESDAEEATERRGRRVDQMKKRPILDGSFDPESCAFSPDASVYPMKVSLAPARSRCLVCGASAGAGRMLTPVALGSSAAVRVLAEGLAEGLSDQHLKNPPKSYDGKERILIFADSRQDAAHQARFITYAGRYDRMRRRLVRILKEAGRPLPLGDAVKRLMVVGAEAHDNPHIAAHAKVAYLSETTQRKAQAWEEAPLLDDIAVSAGYRATVLNLGLVAVRYSRLAEFVTGEGAPQARALGLTPAQLLHLCRCLLDEMRVRRALSRPMLCFHPGNPSCPEEFRQAADWERRLKTPQGFSCDGSGGPVSFLDANKAPDGVTVSNIWRRPGRGGRSPRLQAIFERLMKRMGGKDASPELLLGLLKFLSPNFVHASKLSGYRNAMELLQVNAECVSLELLDKKERLRCSVCNAKLAGAPAGLPCPSCHGVMEPWPAKDLESNRYVQRILKAETLPLVAGEHTAQITGDQRIELEESFKGGPDVSPINVLACSPTLELGIDVGGLDGVIMRNVPPRPDNYAQRGGRAGRRTRVGIVLGYARNTPHDQYFYDKPSEMIAGEVTAPPVALGNRDVVVRHLNAIAISGAHPGLAGRMAEYISLQGERNQEAIDQLMKAFESRFEHATDLALQAWGPEILEPVGLETKEKLMAVLAAQPARVDELFDRVRLQVVELQQRVKQWAELGTGAWTAISAMELCRRLLGLPGDRDVNKNRSEADDRGSGHPMRRFAEFGILPGYEFPTEPATLRLLRDEHEEETISVVRRFGLAQYQPEATAHARGHRWKVVGLDTTSPWNPRTDEPQWLYVVCGGCGLRFGALEHPACPRCARQREAGQPLPGFEFGGFLAVRDDTPIAEDEDRFALANLLRCYPQWSGDVVGRYLLPTGWSAELRREEEVRWVNEGKPPTEGELKRGVAHLSDSGRGFTLCPSCGRILEHAEGEKAGKSRKAPRKSGDADPFGHASGCKSSGQPPIPLAITTKSRATTLRFLVDLPLDLEDENYRRWGLSLGYALRSGMRSLFMLDGPEVEFELEPAWKVEREGRQWRRGALTFLDPAVGGSGFLDRAAPELHLVAKRALDHLDHAGCETACYRCLKAYQNQRFHASLSWPHAVPDLEVLAASAPVIRAAKLGDVHDPVPWLDAYDSGVGSPLELRFLRLFERAGIAVEKQVPVAPAEGGPPISVADFAIAARRIAIYVDGSAFHKGMNLRRDRSIRTRLRGSEHPWKVIELTSADLAREAEVVRQIGEG